MKREQGEGGCVRGRVKSPFFDQEEFAGLTSQYLKQRVKGQVCCWANIGKVMRERVRTETPKVDYLVGQLFFDEIVKDIRMEDEWARDMRERLEFDLYGDMAADTFGNGENV